MTPLPGSGAAVLQGESPEHLTEHREAILELIDSIRESVPEQMANQELIKLRQYLFADAPSTVTILGERGSGKTTLMFAVCGELMRRNVDLVLPPLHPELFSANESVISAFLASLWAIFVDYDDADRKEALGDDQVDTDLIRLLADSARSHAASQTSREALAHATDSTIDFAEDAVAISRSSARLPGQVGELARRICLPAEGPPRLMIVPVDDPDLAPGKVRSILRDLRVLGSIPGVVPIASFCRADLADAWTLDHPASSESGRQAFLYEREMEKLFPYRSRFEIQPFAAGDRVSFAPVGENEPLREKLGNLDRALGGTRLSEAFTRTDPLYRLPNPLPQNPRTLVQLWSMLDQIDSRHGEIRPAVIDQALRSLCALLSEPLRVNLGLDPGDDYYELGIRDTEDDSDRTEIAVNLHGTEIYGRFLTQLNNANPGQSIAQLGFRGLGGITAAKPDPDSTDGRRRELPAIAASALLAFQEVTLGSNRFHVIGSGTRLDRNDWLSAQEVTIAGMATDDYFFTLPEAATLSEIFEVGAAWQGLVEMAERGARNDELLCAAVVASLGPMGGAPEHAPQTYTQAIEAATDLYEQAKERDDRSSARFRSWYEFDLPMHWHSALLEAEVLHHCFATYLEAAEDALKRDVDSLHKSPRALIDVRFERILSVITDDEDRARHCWIAGYFELADALGSSHLQEISTLGPFWRSRTNTLRAGSQVAETLTLAPGADRFAPYVTDEGLDLFMQARDLLRRRRVSATRESARKQSR
jgi:hypothetical protein